MTPETPETMDSLQAQLAVQKRITETAIRSNAHWDDVSEELVWGDDSQAPNYDGPISDRHMLSVIARYPQFTNDIKSWVEDWNRQPRLTDEMLEAVEITPEDTERSAYRAIQILNFYTKLRKVEESRDELRRALEAVIQHHTKLNNKVGRPLENSKTIAICRAALARLKEPKSQ